MILFFIAIAIGLIDRIMVSNRVNRDLKISDCQKSYQIGDGHIDAALAISDDGDMLAALDSGNLMFIDSQTGKVLAESVIHFDIAHVSISPDGKLAAGIQRGVMGGPEYYDYSGDEIIILIRKEVKPSQLERMRGMIFTRISSLLQPETIFSILLPLMEEQVYTN